MPRLRASKKEEWTFNRILAIALSARIFLIFYGKIHDHMFDVDFTDVDYRVFSDAARLVVAGRSPFERATYRYTPFLACLLTPNVFWPEFGKFLFCFLDCLSGYLLYKLAVSEGCQRESICSTSSERERITSRKSHSQPTDCASRHSTALFGVVVFWLFNPFVAIISARGSADSLVCFAVILTLYVLEQTNGVSLAAVIHGALAAHLKIYPVIYLPSIFLYLAYRGAERDILPNKYSQISCFGSFVRRCATNQHGCIFVMLSSLFFCVTLAIGYLLYNEKFLDEFLFYHVVRRDIRHNFSPYFYPLYLAESGDETYAGWTRILGLGAFLPQISCIVAFALKYHDDLPFCWFLTTFAFVTFNKVSTSQYFIWYLCFLPLVYNRINISIQKSIVLTSMWFGVQGIWLFFAYLFEFRGLDTLLYVWVASLLFLLVNCALIGVAIRNYQPILKFSSVAADEQLVESDNTNEIVTSKKGL